MKTSILLAATAIGGLGLATGLALILPLSPAPITGATPAPPPAAPAAAEPAAPAGNAVTRCFTNHAAPSWNAVESEDYRQYVANLRAMGCPEATVRDIIVADVNKLYAARERALVGGTNKFEFWKKQRPALDEARLAQKRELLAEKRAVLKELLGADAPAAESGAVSQSEARKEQVLGFLPREKQDQVAELRESCSMKVQALMAGKARPDKSDLERIQALESELRENVAQRLTPQEMEDLELRASGTANYLRATLGDFEMTEEEFCAVFKLRKGLDEQYGYTSHEDPRKVAAEVAVEQQVKAALGDDRYAQYTRERNWSTSTLRNVARDFNIPKETAVQVFDLKGPAQEAATRIRMDSSLAPAQRQEALLGLQQATVEGIARAIGADAAQAYAREGSWIRALSREK